MNTRSRVWPPFLFLILWMACFWPSQVELMRLTNESYSYTHNLKPIEKTEYRQLEDIKVVGVRGRMAPFQLCLVCKCCASSSSSSSASAACTEMPCCFGIDCRLPNKPYGVCAFVPKACNCTSCPAT